MEKKIWALIVIFLVATTAYGTYNYIVTSHETIVVGYLPSDHDSALFVANAKNMFEKEGLIVNLVPFRSGPDLINAAKLGKIDIGYCGISPVTIAIDNGVPIKIVASVNQEGSGIVVGNNTDINSIADLKGKSIAIPKVNSVQDVLLTYWLSQYNISRNEVNITESEVPYMPRSLLFKKFDGYVAWEPYVSAGSMEGDGKILSYSKNDSWKNFPCCVVIATDSFAKDQPNALRKFLNVHIEVTNYVNTHKNETALIVSQKLGTSVQIEEESLKNVDFNILSQDEFRKNVFKFIDIQKQLGYIKNNASNVSYFDFSFRQES
ncbi:ABC transporter substrate-binding protein [Methanobacterium sp.]|uniref:ABC transporter substrate-binding protein n=1 Tax=Methanobacterium sp. TaxID=2164 RepID=UPI003C748058